MLDRESAKSSKGRFLFFHSRYEYKRKPHCMYSGILRRKAIPLLRDLVQELEIALKEMGIINLYACIGDPEIEDEYLTKNSENFHQHMGYTKVGEFHKCGYKFGRWYNMIWMEKMIGEHSSITA